MNGSDSPGILWMLISLQLFGLASACITRLSEGSCYQALSQYLFFVALPLVGVATATALAVGPACWSACTATLALMLLTVTCDFRSGRQAATW
jgi:hypothetical protein